MFQHTSVHIVAGRYSYFLWMIFFGYLFYELNLKIKGKNYLQWFKYTWPFLLIYGLYGFGYINTRTLAMNFYRIYDYSRNYDKASNGDKDEQLKLFSNKFSKAYGQLPNDWMKSLEKYNINIDDNIKYEFSKLIDGELYVLLKSNKYERNFTKKLYINDKFVDISYPNEYELYFQEDTYTVLKFSDIDTVKSISLK
jgi:hypothetical protein